MLYEVITLYGQNVVPTRLLQAGFRFSYPEVTAALKHCLNPASSS